MFEATLESPVEVEGRTLIPAGTTFTGRVMASASAVREPGRALLACALDSFELDGRRYPIHTERVQRANPEKESSGFLPGTAGLKAAIGVFAGRGGGVRTVAAPASAEAPPDADVGFEAESVVTFTVEEPFEL
jgi:hypothetical protein